ncbi:MAG: pyridoxamine 5'-phosphate oxidase family protein, partial [Thermoanaerobaculia bacterium]|nr:pyridoxamine 5'-phosphate oxidase family protein [Thermoanaerobaculia bacterium]
MLASIDPGGAPWASPLLGPAGFVQAPDLGRLRLDLRVAASYPEDPLWRNLESDPRLGVLLIELATRRRLRVNGRASIIPERVLEVAVDEAYPNCPQYIQRRHPTPASKLADFVPAPARR